MGFTVSVVTFWGRGRVEHAPYPKMWSLTTVIPGEPMLEPRFDRLGSIEIPTPSDYSVILPILAKRAWVNLANSETGRRIFSPRCPPET